MGTGLSEQQRREIAGAVVEVDPAQIVIWRQMTIGHKARLALSMIHAAEKIRHRRLRENWREASSQTGKRFTRGVLGVKNWTKKMADETIGFEDFMRLVIDSLEDVEIDYLIGGAVGLWAWGELRTTADFDVVINLPIEKIIPFSESLRTRDFLVPPEILLDLLTSPADLPVNAIHLTTGFKAELFLLRPGDDLRATALQRRLLADFGTPLGEVYVHSPEDLIIYKLLYYSLSQQPKHIRDIASIVQTIGDDLEIAYIHQWVARLGLDELWQEVWAQLYARPQE